MERSAIDRHHVYGPTTILGQATAVLGNKYNGIGDTIQIDQATFVLCNDARLSEDWNRRGTKRKRTIAISERCDEEPSCEGCSRDQCCAGSRSEERDRRISRGARTTGHRAKLLNSGYVIVNRFLDAVSLPFTSTGPSGKATLNADAHSPRSLVGHSAEQCAAPLPSSVLALPSEEPTWTRHKRKLLDYGIPATILSILACRTLSIEAVLGALSNLRHDSLLPILSAILGSWATNLAQRTSLHEAHVLSGLNSDCTLFEDVYQIQRKVPLAYFSDEGILRAFFAAHYRGSTAEQFIADEQYYVTTKTRSGQPLSLAELCSGTISPSARLFMAILYRVRSLKCLECLNKLQHEGHVRQGAYKWYGLHSHVEPR